MYEDRKEALIQGLYDQGILHDPRIERAFLMVPLEEYIPPHLQIEEMLYADTPQVFFFKSTADRRTISAPHMITIMLEYTNLRSNDQLLMLGCKSGYIEAIASLLCSEGHVYCVDSSEAILKFARDNLRRTGFGDNVSLIHGNPLTMDFKVLSSYDKVLIPYQVEEPDVYPALRKLNDNGVLFAPIGDARLQYFTQILKSSGTYYGNRISTVVFSPLDKNVTFLSQQVQFLEIVKKLGRQATVTSNLEAAIRSARSALEARRVQAAVDPIRIVYDSEVGDELAERYRQETVVSPREQSMDFKIVEAISVQLASRYRGSVRVVTLMNALDMPFDMIKFYLKKSTAGRLTGDMDDPKSLKFTIEAPLVEKDPATANALKELAAHGATLQGLLKESTISEFSDLLRYVSEKLDFLEREKGVRIKSTSMVAKQMVEKVDMLQAAKAGEGHDWAAARARILGDLQQLLEDLRSALQRF
ncbi:MAG: methyltransferase domain-containing protein [Candidatus Lokiarchaeota archaeon]|nr:methyltransferase domain-containing protein [Candidatus Lokiarchaeota archaeon]